MGITSHGFSTNYVKVEFKQTGIPHTTSIYAYKGKFKANNDLDSVWKKEI